MAVEGVIEGGEGAEGAGWRGRTSVFRVSPSVVVGRPPSCFDEVCFYARHFRVVSVSHLDLCG